MKKWMLVFIVFCLTWPSGKVQAGSGQSLSIYGCTKQNVDRSQNNPVSLAVQTVCIVYDPNMDRHFIINTVTSVDGSGTSIVEEK